MKIANIILFHKDAMAVKRLIRTLHHPSFDFFLHLDRKVNITAYQHLGELPQTCFVKDRKAVRWAGYSQTEAALNAIREILEHPTHYDFVNLLSGQDYPIRPVEEIATFFENNIGKSFVQSEVPPSKWWNEAGHRYKNYHFGDYGFRGRYRLGETLSRILPERKFPLDVTLYGGPNAAYWIISRDAAQYLYDTLTSNKSYARFLKHTWGPDEFIVNTVLMNSPYTTAIVNDNFRYMDRSDGGSRPKLLTSKDFPALQSSTKFFARKFDASTDADVLDMIDEQLLLKKR